MGGLGNECGPKSLREAADAFARSPKKSRKMISPAFSPEPKWNACRFGGVCVLCGEVGAVWVAVEVGRLMYILGFPRWGL